MHSYLPYVYLSQRLPLILVTWWILGLALVPDSPVMRSILKTSWKLRPLISLLQNSMWTMGSPWKLLELPETAAKSQQMNLPSWWNLNQIGAYDVQAPIWLCYCSFTTPMDPLRHSYELCYFDSSKFSAFYLDGYLCGIVSANSAWNTTIWYNPFMYIRIIKSYLSNLFCSIMIDGGGRIKSHHLRDENGSTGIKQRKLYSWRLWKCGLLYDTTVDYW